MSWVTEAQVEGELSYEITTLTQPTTAEVATFILAIEAQVQGILNSVKINPAGITESGTPNTFLVVQQWALWGVCARVIAAAGGLIRSQPQKERNYWDRYNTCWHEIKEDPNTLGTDAPFYTGDTNMIWPDGIVSTDADYNTPEFTMDMEF